MRILYQSTTEIEHHPKYLSSLTHKLDAAASPGTTVDVRGVPAGTWGGLSPSQDMSAPYAYLAALAAPIIASAVRAEGEGYDAIILASYTEPFLRECRSVVDIPVVSAPESTFAVALSAAPLVGLVTLNEENWWFLKGWAARNKFSDRIEGIHVVSPALDEIALDSVFDDQGAYLDGFIATARRSIAAGADAIVPAEGILATLVSAAGITDIDGVSVLDGIATTLAYAELLARLHQTTGLHAGRRWHYRKPSADARERLPFAF